MVRKLAGSPTAALLSLADPGWLHGRWDDGAGTMWQHHTYRSLAELLAGSGRAAEADPFEGLTLQRWTDTVRLLCDLGDLVGRPHPEEPVWLSKQVRRDLARCRLDVPVQKLRAHHVASELRSRLRGRGSEEVSVVPGVAHGVGLVEAFARVGEKVEAGWQLQGADWRMAVRFMPGHALHGRGDALRARRAWFADHTGWASFAAEAEL